MVLLITGVYSLITILAYLIRSNAGYTLVPGIAVDQNAQLPPRLEIRTFIQDPIRLNIYLLALERIQQTPTSELLSHYRISGIHGTNSVWDGDTGGNYPNGLGYCHHADRLFPTWHRPYLSLYENTLYDLATQIVQEFPTGPVKDRHLATLTTWRMPYWDWAMDASMPAVMGATNAFINVMVTKMRNGRLVNVTIPNPLYSYRFQIPDDSNTIIPRSSSRSPRTIETVRNPISRNGVYQSQLFVTNNRMIRIGSSLKNDVLRALSLSTDYISFSNMVDGYDSIENVHGTVHVTIGGRNGHMGAIELAAFDPIFYLHHANIDRLFAIWQVIYPDSYVSTNTSDVPNENTELHPFRRTQSEYWTSKTVRDIKAFGYTYPELIDADRQSVITAVNNLYGQMLSLSSGKRKRQMPNTDSNTTKEDKENVDFFKTDMMASYNEYIVHIKIANTAVKGSFVVNIFLGEPTANASNYDEDPNYVGSFDVFARKNQRKSCKKMVKGTLSMTTALYKLYATSKLPDMTPKTVKAYLKNNLRWTITGDDTKDLDLDGYEIIVGRIKIGLPNRRDALPIWGKFSAIYKAC